MNKVFLIGNLTRDPELSNTTSGVAMCRMGIAVNRNFANANGEREVDFFNLTAWRGLAERCGKYLHKGSKVSVIGSLQVRSYEVNGEKRTATDIVLEDVEFLTPRGEGSSNDAGVSNAPTSAPVETKQVTELEPVDDTDLPF